jgi:hypothetical protein
MRPHAGQRLVRPRCAGQRDDRPRRQEGRHGEIKGVYFGLSFLLGFTLDRHRAAGRSCILGWLPPAAMNRTNSTPVEMNLASTADYRRYEDMRKTQSHADLGSTHSSLVGGFSRTSSLADLAYVAVPGLTSRVVQNNSVVSLANLSDNFTEMPEHESPVVLKGGPSRPLWGSAIVALLSTLMYGYNNANMNTPAKPMRAALGIPTSALTPDGVVVPLPSNDIIWSFIISIFMCAGNCQPTPPTRQPTAIPLQPPTILSSVSCPPTTSSGPSSSPSLCAHRDSRPLPLWSASQPSASRPSHPPSKLSLSSALQRHHLVLSCSMCAGDSQPLPL